MALEIDFETRSDVDIRKRGVYVYMESPNTSPILASYKLNNGPVRRWRVGQPCPPEIVAHVEAGGEVHAHNNQFERLLWQKVLTPRYGWPVLRLEQCRCTAAMAAAMSLPRDLAGLGRALGLATQKDDEGYRLMLQLSKPRRPRKGEPDGLYWREEPEKIDRLHDYCDRDVETEALAEARMVPLSDAERAVYLLDQTINDRGVRIDTRLVRAMMRIVEQTQTQLDREMVQATGGYVTAASQVARLTAWLKDNGVPAESLAKAAVDELLSLEDVPERCRQALEIRKEAAKSSTAKLKAALECACADGRARGLLLYHGAGTGRWSGKLLQPQNFPRPDPKRKIDSDRAVRHMRSGSADLVRWLYDNPLGAVADCLKSIIMADPGKELLAADFSNIEGRVNAWQAGEEAELDAFRAYDEGTGPDLYKVTASGITGKAVTAITSDERQALGKVPTLALGFQGGVNAFFKMGQNYPGTDKAVRAAFPALWGRADDALRTKAEKRWKAAETEATDAAVKLGHDGWLAAELIKVNWRAAHPAISGSWNLLEDAIREAVQQPGAVVSVLKVRYLLRNGFLWCRLPSGRCLAYGMPKLHDMVWVKWKETDAKETLPRAEAEGKRDVLVIEGDAKSKVTALGVDSVTRKWQRFALYGGLACENIVQAIARDVMAAAMLKAEAAGYPIVLTVHDEIVAEVAEGFGSVDDFERLICDAPAWAARLPVVAEGWRNRRYKK